MMSCNIDNILNRHVLDTSTYFSNFASLDDPGQHVGNGQWGEFFFQLSMVKSLEVGSQGSFIP